MDSPDPCNMGLGPSSVLHVPRYGSRLAFGGPWSGALATMHPAPVAVGDDGVLARRSFAGFSQAPLAWPMGPEPRTTASFNELFAVN